MKSKILYSAANNGFYDSALHSKTLPEDAIEITEEKYKELLLAQQNGSEIRAQGVHPCAFNKVPFQPDNHAQERLWRDTELKKADIELFKVQDSDPTSYGTVSEWREYRRSLRAWPANANFPQVNFRPKPPVK